MTARTKLGWVDISRQSLREGLACGEGGVRVMLLMGEDRHPVGPSSRGTSPREAQPEARPPEKAR
jgi:hypothetical protein